MTAEQKKLIAGLQQRITEIERVKKPLGKRDIAAFIVEIKAGMLKAHQPSVTVTALDGGRQFLVEGLVKPKKAMTHTCERKACNKPAIHEKTDDQWLCQKPADKLDAFWGDKRKKKAA